MYGTVDCDRTENNYRNYRHPYDSYVPYVIFQTHYEYEYHICRHLPKLLPVSHQGITWAIVSAPYEDSYSTRTGTIPYFRRSFSRVYSSYEYSYEYCTVRCPAVRLRFSAPSPPNSR